MTDRRMPAVLSLTAMMATLFVSSRARAEVEVHALEARLRYGVHRVGYSTVGGGTRWFSSARGGLGATLPSLFRARLDALIGHFSSGELVGSGVGRLYAMTDRFALGASYGHTAVGGGLTSDTFGLHGEVYEERWLTVTSSFGWERKPLFDDLFFGEIFLRTYPMRHLLVSAGASYAVSELKQTRADIIGRAEYTLVSTRWWSPALFAQYGGNTYTRVEAGVTVYFDALDYAGRERRDGFYGARFD